MSSTVLLILAVAMAVVTGMGIALTINDRSGAARSRRQAETQRNLNEASLQLLRLLHDLEASHDDLKRRIVAERHRGQDRDDG